MIKSEKAKMIAGELFNVYDPELVSERAIARQQVEAFNQLGETNPHKSQQIIKRLFTAWISQIGIYEIMWFDVLIAGIGVLCSIVVLTLSREKKTIVA